MILKNKKTNERLKKREKEKSQKKQRIAKKKVKYKQLSIFPQLLLL